MDLFGNVDGDLDPTTPTSHRAVDMDFFPESQSSAVGRGVPPTHGASIREAFDLNSDADEFPQINSYHEYLQSVLPVVNNSGSSRLAGNGCGVAPRCALSSGDANPSLAKPFCAPRPIASVSRGRGGRRGTAVTGSSTPQQLGTAAGGSASRGLPPRAPTFTSGGGGGSSSQFAGGAGMTDSHRWMEEAPIDEEEGTEGRSEWKRLKYGLPECLQQLEEMFAHTAVDGSTSCIPGEQMNDGGDKGGSQRDVFDGSPMNSGSKRPRSSGRSTCATSPIKKGRSPMVKVMKVIWESLQSSNAIVHKVLQGTR